MHDQLRITAGPIDNLDARIEDLERVGFVSFKGSRWNYTMARMETPTKTIELDGLKNYLYKTNFIEAIKRYLAENNLYLTHANYRASDILGFIPPQISGDLYRQR